MNDKKRPFEAKKTFGLSVLLKLTRKSIPGITISEHKGKLTSNLNMEELNRAVDMTLQTHNIKLRLE
jgi:hypothetical protein